MLLRSVALAFLLAAACSFPATAQEERKSPVDPDDPPPEGVTQIIPRGRLVAIDDPVFVSAEDSKLPDDAWILGVAMDGEAHAYSLNLLNRHEVVNDRIGEQPFAAVW